MDYVNLKNYLQKIGNVDSINFYTGYQVENMEQNNRFIKMESEGFRIIKKKVKLIRVSYNRCIKKGNLDVELALDAYSCRETYDTIFLFSGDSDFAYLLQLLKVEGKKVIVFSTGGHIANDLLSLADHYQDIKKLAAVISQNQQTPELAPEGF